MTKKRLMSLLLCIVMAAGFFPADSLAVQPQQEAPGFSDMPDDWSARALQNAAANGLLRGAGGKIMPNDNLTRAQMAAVIVRAFGAAVEKELSAFQDVHPSDWFAGDLAKAYQMGVIQGADGKMNPESAITRQEAFAIVARALKLTPAETVSKTFSDAGMISEWARGEVYALVNAGYIQGSDGKLNPGEHITRAQFAQLFDNIVKQYIGEAGVVTVVSAGNVMVSVPSVTLKDLTVDGDLIIGDGVGDGEVTLENVRVTGRMVVRGGGEHSVIIRGSSSVSHVIVSRADGAVSVKVEGDADVEVIFIDDGSDDVNIAGAVGTIEVKASDIRVSVAEHSTVGAVRIQEGAANTRLEVSGSVSTVTTSAPGTEVTGTGTVTKVEAQAGADGAKILTPKTEISVSSGVAGVTGGGGAAIDGGSTQTNNGSASGTIPPAPPSGGGGGGSTAVPDASLTGLTISVGTLSPAFAGSTYGYNVTVANEVTSITVTPAGAGAITVDGTVVPSGSASAAILLMTPGDVKTIPVVVTETGKTPKTYMLYVTRALSGDATAASTASHYTVNNTANTITASNTAIYTTTTVGAFLGNLTKHAEAQWKVLASAASITNADDFNGAAGRLNTACLETGDLLAVMAQDGTIRVYAIAVVLDTSEGDNNDITAAQAALHGGTLSPVEGTNASVVTMAETILAGVPEAAGVTVTVSDASGNSKVGADGAITYTGAAVTGNVVFALNKGMGTQQTATMSVAVPANTTEADNAAILAAQAALHGGTLSPVEGTNASVLTMAETILAGVPEAAGVTVTVSDASGNSKVGADGAITYTGAAVTGNVVFALNKGMGTQQTATMSVVVPAGNFAPTGTPQTSLAIQNMKFSLGLSTIFTDDRDDPAALTYTVVGDDGAATPALAGGGKILEYTPTAADVGNIVVITVRATDTGSATSEPVTITLSVVAEFAGGAGTVGEPWQISTPMHLNNIRNYAGAASVGKYFVLVNDIDMAAFLGESGPEYNDGEGWRPIGGSYDTAFRGTFLGNNNTISNLRINRPSQNYVGLFGYAYGHRVENLFLTDVSISGRGYTGSLIGTSGSGGTISNVAVTGTVSGSYQRAGGFIGESTPGNTINNSYARVNVSSASQQQIGGFTGLNSGTIQNCYNVGTVNGGSSVGGFAGVNGGTISNCYTVSEVTGSGSVGAFIGFNSSGTILNSYYDSTVSGRSDTGNGEPRTTAEMLQQSNYTGWDFAAVWGINASENSGYPFLRWQGYTHISNDATLSSLTVGGQDVMALPNLEVSSPAEAGAELAVDDFTGFTGIVTHSSDSGATIAVQISGTPVNSDDLASWVIEENDVIVVAVTAQDGTAQKYYKVTAVLAVSELTGADVTISSGSVIFGYTLQSAAGPVTYGEALAAPYYLNADNSTVTLTDGTGSVSKALSALGIANDGTVTYDNIAAVQGVFTGLSFIPSQIQLHLVGATTVNGGTDQWTYNVTVTLDPAEIALLTPDITPPTVTAATQSVTNEAGQAVTARSSEAGTVFIILDGEAHATQADIQAALAGFKASAKEAPTPDTDVSISTTGLTGGTYHAYAVDTYGNISGAGANAITVTQEIEPGSVDKSVLNTALFNAGANKSSVTVSADGTNVYAVYQWVTTATMTTYEGAISSAQAVADNGAATQAEIDGAVSALAGATATFNSAKQPGTKLCVTSITLQNATDAVTATLGVPLAANIGDVLEITAVTVSDGVSAAGRVEYMAHVLDPLTMAQLGTINIDSTQSSFTIPETYTNGDTTHSIEGKLIDFGARLVTDENSGLAAAAGPVEAAAGDQTPAPSSVNMSVTNGGLDYISIVNLDSNAYHIRVYNAASGGDLIAETYLESDFHYDAGTATYYTESIVSGGLNSGGGTIWVTLQAGGKTESTRTAVPYPAE